MRSGRVCARSGRSDVASVRINTKSMQFGAPFMHPCTRVAMRQHARSLRERMNELRCGSCVCAKYNAIISDDGWCLCTLFCGRVLINGGAHFSSNPIHPSDRHMQENNILCNNIRNDPQSNIYLIKYAQQLETT